MTYPIITSAGSKKGDLALEVTKLRTPAHPQHELPFRLHPERSSQLPVWSGGAHGITRDSFWRGPRPRRIHPRFRQGIESRFPDISHRGGIALAPEDRKQQGLVIDMTVLENLSLALARGRKKVGFLDFRERENDFR